MNRLISLLVFVLILIVAPISPAHSADKNNLSGIILLLNTKPLMTYTVEIATTQFGGQLDAAVAVLLSAEQGYSWGQIIGAIEAETLKEDGSITGISPQQFLLHQKTLSIQPALSNYPPGTIRDAVERNFARNQEVLTMICRAICMGYTFNQVMDALIEEELLENGLIRCSSLEEKLKGLCIEIDQDGYDLKFFKLPELNEKTIYWKDCQPAEPIMDTPYWASSIKGCWENSYYLAIIEDAPQGYIYIGSGPGFKHSGIISWQDIGKYEGDLEDDPDYCCGNNGHLWLEIVNENTTRIRSIWHTPDGALVKETDWENLSRAICD